MTDTNAGRPMIERMKRAALLDPQIYEEVEADASATGQAATVVAIVAVAQGIGSATQGVPGILAGIIAALLGWLIWSGVTYVIGDKILGGTATWGELLRTLGFAQSPAVLAIFAIVPGVGGLIRLGITGLGADRGYYGDPTGARLQHRQGHPDRPVVCDIRARAPSGARIRVSYPVSDSMSCIRRAKQHGSETRRDLDVAAPIP